MTTKLKESYHVLLSSDGDWGVKKNGSTRVSAKFKTKRGAISRGCKLVVMHDSELFIHGRDGEIVRKLSEADCKKSSVAMNSHDSKKYI